LQMRHAKMQPFVLLPYDQSCSCYTMHSPCNAHS
jgi:hypothetical protein